MPEIDFTKVEPADNYTPLPLGKYVLPNRRRC